MTENLAIISGKGGSGKTTLAISLAQLLATCKKNVLLVDCDMSTHGATYFFENQLSEKNKYVTFVDFLNGKEYIYQKNILQVAPNIGFIPSCVDFPSKLINYENTSKSMFDHFCEIGFYNENGVQYDIVIFDCQAGYSIATDVVTKFTKRNLAVIEADAISASSLRVLYSQLSKQLDNGQTYQIFNKITKEEQDVYSKLTHGTLFTNLNPILFDWNVRKAFVTNDLPNIDTSNPMFTSSIYNLAIAIFPMYKEELRKFIVEIKERMLSILNEKILDIKFERRKKSFRIALNRILPIYAILLPIIPLFILYFFDYEFHIGGMLTLMTSTMAILSAIMWLFLGRQRDNETQEKQTELRREQERLMNEINQLTSKMIG